MLKIIGSLMLIVACSLMGCLKANSYKERKRELENILETIKLMDMYITYRREPLRKVFINTAKYRKSWFTDILNKCVEQIDEHQDFEIAWKKSIVNNIETSPVIKEDITIIEDMMIGLGKSDIAGQRRILESSASRIKDQLADAIYKEKSLGKLYRTLGVAAGIVITIIIV